MNREAIRPAFSLAGYGAGSFGVNVLGWPLQTLLMYFLTDSVGFSIALATLVVTAPKVWDVFMDPFIGAWADRSAARTGHRGRVLLGTAALLPATVVTVFMLPSQAPSWTAVLVIAALIVHSSAFMAYFISQVALADDFEQAGTARRDSALALRVVGQATGSLCAGALGPLLIGLSGSGSKDYLTMAVVLSVAGVTGLVAVALTARRFKAGSMKAETHAKVSLGQALRAAWHNRAAGALIVSNFGVYVATSVTATFTPYMNKLLLGSDDTSMAFLFSSFMVAMLSGSALAAWGTRRYARLRVLAAGAGVMFIAALLIWPTAVPGAVPAASAVNALWGLGLGIYALVIFSATLDLSQASAAGAGLLLGLLISTGKIGDSLGGVLVGAILGWAGYSAGAVVDLEMANTLRTTYALSAVLAMTLSVAVLLPQLRSADRPETPQ
jgi:Na+/melibiose symporter-like transporter